LKSVYNRGLSDGYYLGREQGWSAHYGSKATKQKIQVGRVSHFYNQLSVAEITSSGNVSVGDEYVIIGDTTGVVDGKIEEMRLDEGQVQLAKPKDVFSIRVPKKVRKNDKVYIMKPVNS